MIKRFFQYLLMVSMMIVIVGCGFEEPVPSGSIIVADDFSVDEGRWMTTIDPDHSMVGYQAGGMRFVVNSINRDYFSIYKTPYTHVILDVDTTKLAGPDNNIMGIVCRYQDMENYYGFLISSDGYYGIIAKVNGTLELLTDGEMHYKPDVIFTGAATNHIRVGCVHDALWIEINGKTLAGLYNDALVDGKIGLIAGTMSNTGVDVLFDNFSVIQP